MRTRERPDLSAPGDSPSPTPSRDALDAVESALQRCSTPPSDRPAENPWREVLYERLRDRALPAMITDGAITPAASIWTGARLWTEAFRETDLESGDRIVISLPPSAAFVQVLVAALWDGLTIALAPETADVAPLLDDLDARAAVTVDEQRYAWTADEFSGPSSVPRELRPSSEPRSRDVRLLLRTSGTTGPGRWVALSDRNVLSVLASHLPHLSLRNARVLSVLPWTHAFGLVLDLLPALLSGAEIIRDPSGGRSPEQLVALGSTWGATHLSAVPLTIQRLLDTAPGRDLLQNLDGGIVGGAPVSGPLATALSNTALRAGYGQTEASPGISLGRPGRWSAQYLGRPVGCSVTIAPDGELLFRGPNACVGFWQSGRLVRKNPDRTVHTGDLVRREDGDLFFRGRKDDSFTLSNGRLVEAGAIEGTLKATFPGLRDVLVFTPNGDDVAIALCPDDPDVGGPSHTDVRDALGALGKRLVWTTTVPPDDWVTLPKGPVDRDAMTTTLSEIFDSG